MPSSRWRPFQPATAWQVISPLSPWWRRWIEKRVEQVLRNLLDNAIKYSPEGGTITVQAYADNMQILLAVSDEGIDGIPAEEWERVFERFRTLRTTK